MMDRESLLKLLYRFDAHVWDWAETLEDQAEYGQGARQAAYLVSDAIAALEHIPEDARVNE